jgi:hypothetical protein
MSGQSCRRRFIMRPPPRPAKPLSAARWRAFPAEHCRKRRKVLGWRDHLTRLWHIARHVLGLFAFWGPLVSLALSAPRRQECPPWCPFAPRGTKAPARNVAVARSVKLLDYGKPKIPIRNEFKTNSTECPPKGGEGKSGTVRAPPQWDLSFWVWLRLLSSAPTLSLLRPDPPYRHHRGPPFLRPRSHGSYFRHHQRFDRPQFSAIIIALAAAEARSPFRWPEPSLREPGPPQSSSLWVVALHRHMCSLGAKGSRHDRNIAFAEKLCQN